MDFENLPFNTGSTPSLSPEEVIDRYWDKIPVEEQKKIVKAAYRQIAEKTEIIEGLREKN